MPLAQGVVINGNLAPQLLIWNPCQLMNSLNQKGISNSVLFKKRVFFRYKKPTVILRHTEVRVALIYQFEQATDTLIVNG